MELSVVKETENQLVFELIGEDHTFCNLLRDTLWEDKSVDMAAYKLDHPLTRKPTFMLIVKKGEPRSVLKRTAEKITARFSELGDKLSRAASRK